MAPRFSAHLGRSGLPIGISDTSSRTPGVSLMGKPDTSLYFVAKLKARTTVIKSDRWEQHGDF